MCRADRMFQIIQLLSQEKAIIAHFLSQSLEVTERTICRDVQDLSLSGVPITGEACIGYHFIKCF